MMLLLIMLLLPSIALAQPTPAALPTDAQQIQAIIQQSGCQYEVNAASQTIASLQKQVNDLEKQLAAVKDPPKKR